MLTQVPDIIKSPDVTPGFSSHDSISTTAEIVEDDDKFYDDKFYDDGVNDDDLFNIGAKNRSF